MALEQIGVEATIQGLSSFRRGIGNMNDDVRGFGRTADGIVPGLNSMGSSLLSLGGIAAGAVVAGFAAATVAVGAFAAGGIKSAIEMEDQMGNIASVMNTTKAEIQPLADLIIDLGIDPGLKVSAEEAAQAIELLARNGLSMQEILDGAAKSTVLLANATGAEFGNAADIATDAMAIFGIEAKDMIGVVDSIVGVTTNSKFTIDDFALALRNGGAAADLLGVPLDDFNTVIAATAEEMGSGMRAGTGFRNFLTRLTPSTEGAASAMMELGLITADGTNQFFDAQGNIRDMAEVSGVLQEALKDLTAQEQSAFLELIFGQDALGTAIGLANEGEEGFRELASAMSETDAAAMALERMDSVAGVMEIVSGVIDGLQLQIGQAFLPLVRDLADQFLVFVQDVGPRVVEIFSSVADGISEFVQLLQSGESPLDAFLGALEEAGVSKDFINQLSDLATSIENFVTPIIEFVTEHSEEFKGALMGIGAVLASGVIVSVLGTIAGIVAALVSPIGLLVIGFAALGAAISHFGGIQQIMENIRTFIETTDFAALGQQLINQLLQGASNFGEAFGVWAGNLLVQITDAVNSIDWTLVGQQVMTFIGDAIAAYIGFQLLVGQTIYNFISGGVESQDWLTIGTNILTAIFNALNSFGEGVGIVLMGWYESFIAWVQSVDWGAIGLSILNFVLTGLGNFGVFVGETLAGWYSSFVTWADGIDWVQIGLNIVMFIIDGLVQFTTLVAETLTSWANAYFDWVDTIDWEQIGYDIVTFIITGLADFSEEVAETLDDWYTSFTDWEEEQDWEEIAANIIIGIVEKFQDFWAEAEPKIDGWWTSIKTWFDKMDWLSLGQSIVDGVVDAIQDGIGAVTGAIGGLIQGAIDAAQDALKSQSPSKVFYDFGLSIGQGLILGVNKTAESVHDSILALFDVGRDLGSVGSGFANQFKNTVLPDMEKAIEDSQRTVDVLKDRFVGNFGESLGITGDDEITQRQLVSAYFQAIHSGNMQMKRDIETIWQAQNQLGAATAEYKKAQEDIVALQKAQADLAFIEQQQKLLDMIAEHGLNASDILGGLELGLGADTQGLVQAMTRAIQAIIEQAEDQLGVASPSRVFKEIGGFITGGLAQGIMSTIGNPAMAMESMLNQMVQPMQSQAAMPSVINQPSTTTISKSAQVQFGDVSVGSDMDVQLIGDFIVQKIAEAI